jgi:hypothetical protein
LPGTWPGQRTDPDGAVVDEVVDDVVAGPVVVGDVVDVRVVVLDVVGVLVVDDVVDGCEVVQCVQLVRVQCSWLFGARLGATSTSVATRLWLWSRAKFACAL